MSTDPEPNPTDPEEAIRRDMADALAAIVYSALAVEGSSLPHLEFANRYAEEYFGIAAAAFAADRWIELVHPDDRDGVRAAWAASLATGQHYRHEHRLKLADGTYHRFLTQALPLRDEHGQVVKWYGVATPLDGQPRRRGPPRWIVTPCAIPKGISISLRLQSGTTGPTIPRRSVTRPGRGIESSPSGRNHRRLDAD
jgi:hypothetical protein